MKILICVSGMPHARPTLLFGSLIARPGQSPVTLLTVIDNPAARPLAEAALAQAKANLNLPDVRLVIREGTPANEIIRETKEGKYGMIVVGDHIVRGFFDRFRPKVTQKVIDRAKATVLIVKEETAALNRILICTSGQKIDRQVVKAGIKLAKKNTAVADLLFVSDPVPVMYAGLESMDETLPALLHTTTPLAQQLTWAAAYLTDQGVTGELKMRRGVVADEIALEALEGDYNLVVVGARAGSNFWNDLLVGSITPHIVEKAPCSVLVVRTKTAPPPTD